MWPGAWLSKKLFACIHSRNLIYNACWEDPRIDREALELTEEDRVLVITSAGCNALDYALCGPAGVTAVDVNPRQNALLELKLAGVRSLEYADFFSLFGEGVHAHARDLYSDCLRRELSVPARRFWDDHIGYFEGRARRDSFYFRGTSGLFAYLMNVYIDRVVRLREVVDALLASRDICEQQALYYSHLHEGFWRGWLRWLLGQDAAMSLLGVPGPQLHQIKRHYTRGVVAFIQECIEAVFGQLPLVDNYFWRVYLTGRYTPECCPEYLKPENFELLRSGLADRVAVYTGTVSSYLRQCESPVTKFVLLDHMDWLSTHAMPALAEEWQLIVDRAAPDARIIWRSGGLRTDFVDPIGVMFRGRRTRIGDLLAYEREKAAHLHRQDRVHTYGNFYIANLVTS